MSLRVVKEGTMRILNLSEKYFPSSSINAANGTWFKKRSGTMMNSLFKPVRYAFDEHSMTQTKGGFRAFTPFIAKFLNSQRPEALFRARI